MSVTVAVVGVGDVANRVHLPTWKRISVARIIAICDTDKEKAAATAKQWNIPKYYTQFEEMLDKEKPLVVDVCTPPGSHLPLAIEAMDRGCNVILEKPMSMSIEESRKIIEAYTERKAGGIKLCVIHNLLFESFMSKLRSAIKRDVGDIIGVEIKLLDTPNDSMISDPAHWCHTLPGGRFGECLIHPLYLLQNLLGSMEVENLWVTKLGPYSWVSYDELHVSLSADGKRFGSIYVSFNCPRSSFPTIIIYGKKSILRYEGSIFTLNTLPQLGNGAFDIGFDAVRQTLESIKALTENFLQVITCRRKTGHEGIFRLFIDSVKNNKELPPSLAPEEAYQVNRTYLQVLEKLEGID